MSENTAKRLVVPRATQPAGVWADELTVGDTFTSTGHLVTETEMLSFSGQYDPQPFHLDPVQAQGTFFNGLVASGWLTAAITMRLLVESIPLATGLVGKAVDLTWPSATVAGDQLHVESVLIRCDWSSSNPGRATLVFDSKTVNQDGNIRQSSTAQFLAWARSQPATSDER